MVYVWSLHGREMRRVWDCLTGGWDECCGWRLLPEFWANSDSRRMRRSWIRKGRLRRRNGEVHFHLSGSVAPCKRNPHPNLLPEYREKGLEVRSTVMIREIGEAVCDVRFRGCGFCRGSTSTAVGGPATASRPRSQPSLQSTRHLVW